MGAIRVHRNPDDCGKDCDMVITITDKSGKTKTATVANGTITAIPVEDGDYTVYVKLGKRSKPVTVTVPSNTIDLTATVIPDQTGKIAIQGIDLK